MKRRTNGVTPENRSHWSLLLTFLPLLVDCSVHSTGTLHGTAIILHLDCSNVDEAFKRAVGAGATVSEEVADQPWGQRYGKVIDPFGFVWSFATPHHKHSA
jgi:PhnB protein